MKLKIILLPALALTLVGCKKTEEEPFDFAYINKELSSCYRYFIDTTNLVDGSAGYGLTQDRLSNKNLSSIAATGFALASYPVYVKEGLLDEETAKKYASGTIDTLLRIQADEESSYEGCMSHFVYKTTGKRYGSSEVSTIDTAIAVSGALCAGGYFGDEVNEKANALWGNVNYRKYQVTRNGKSYVSMGIDDPTKESKTQLGAWDYYAEQLMIYILGVGNPNTNHRLSAGFYQSITKEVGSYKDHSFIHSWFGSIFTYQYSQAFFNFKDYEDSKGRNYFNNSVEASLAAYEYCVDNQNKYKTYSDSSWGLTACDTALGYNGNLGTPPRGYGPDANYLKIAGTVAPTGAIGSMPFTPTESNRALKNYLSDPLLNDAKYGIRDSYNLDFNGKAWYCTDIIGIDKGIEVLQMANYKYNNFVSNLSMSNNYVVDGFLGNQFKYVGAK